MKGILHNMSNKEINNAIRAMRAAERANNKLKTIKAALNKAGLQLKFNIDKTRTNNNKKNKL